MNAAQVVASYESLAALTKQMHEAAVRGEWDLLIGFEKQRDALVGSIKPFAATVVLDEAASRRRNQLIDNVFAHDTEIRTLVRSWMEQLQLDIQSDQQQLRLLKKYGA